MTHQRHVYVHVNVRIMAVRVCVCVCVRVCIVERELGLKEDNDCFIVTV